SHMCTLCVFFFFSSRRRHTRSKRDWSSDVCSSDLGIPTMVSNYLEGRDVILHAENGVLGYGRMVSEEHEIDPDIYNAAGQFVALKPGASFFDSVASFEMARGGRIDTVVLGAYEVDQQGGVANWSTADAKRGGI